MFWLKIDVVVKPNTAGRVSESRSKQKAPDVPDLKNITFLSPQSTAGN